MHPDCLVAGRAHCPLVPVGDPSWHGLMAHGWHVGSWLAVDGGCVRTALRRPVTVDPHHGGRGFRPPVKVEHPAAERP